MKVGMPNLQHVETLSKADSGEGPKKLLEPDVLGEDEGKRGRRSSDATRFLLMPRWGYSSEREKGGRGRTTRCND